ncbi:LPP20 family lipoprotein [Treponema sp.]|uniref:LPP20 family lipoprotein n=1 Tax=Treponema sp. TaxID=166 RepID=UPI0025ED61CB|nr:LPP20 family lipoprotein [Treponema sp.]MCR5219013.1 LPP20 family lipoprotein [Treponema sp.]
MKSIVKVFIGLTVFFLVSCSSAKVAVPDYISDCHEYYDNGMYLSAVGEGKTKEEARTNAAAEISRYIQLVINSDVKIETIYSESNGKLDSVENYSTVNVAKTNFTFTGLEYSEFFQPKKTYYVAAYIERSKAYNQVNLETGILKSQFLELYDNAAKEDPLSAYADYENAKKITPALIEKISVLMAINPSDASSDYADCIKKVSLLEKNKSDCLKKSTVQIAKIDGDFENIIYNQVESSLKEAGLSISKGKGTYRAEVILDLNKTAEGEPGDEIYVATPSVEISLMYGDESVYTFNTKTEQKTLAYTAEKLQRESLKKLAKKIASDFTIEWHSKNQ